MKKIVLLLIPLFLIACKEEEENTSTEQDAKFALSTNVLEFDYSGGVKSLKFINADGAVEAVLDEEADTTWCEPKISGDSLTVTVQENILPSGRNAKIQLT
ncbi:MAG: hypothetical protein LBH60_05730, partial [Prevotellaceae bacterium]|nr:hypothetical protein [Prevotellaceae bacterium]